MLQNCKILIAFGFLVAMCYQIQSKFLEFKKIVVHSEQLTYNLLQLYLLFTCFSAAILIFLMIIKQKNIDLVGNVFLLLTSIKAVVCYLIIRPATLLEDLSHNLVKYNFMVTFLMFLLLETIAAVRILNQK